MNSKSLIKTLLIEGCLALLFIAWFVILLIGLNTIPVDGLEAIQDLFNLEKSGAKFYGAVAIFSAVGLGLFYSIIMVLLYYIRAPRKLIYGLNITFYSLAIAGTLSGLLLIFLNF